MKPIDFGSTSEGPKSLDFGSVPNTTSHTKVESNPRPLDFGSVPPVPPPSRAPQSNKPVPQSGKEPGVLSFAQNATGPTAIVESVIRHIEHKHPATFNKSRLSARLNRLIPIELDKITSWGSITLETNLLNEVISLSTRFSKLDGSDIIDNTLKATQKAQTVLTKLIRSSDPLSFKPSLVVLEQSLKTLKDECDKYYNECDKYRDELLMDLACLSAVFEVVGHNNDTRIEKAVHDRKILLTNANQQAQLVILKIEQLVDMINQQINQASQLLTVTLPAYQLART